MVRGPEEQVKKNNNKIYYVGLPNQPQVSKSAAIKAWSVIISINKFLKCRKKTSELKKVVDD